MLVEPFVAECGCTICGICLVLLQEWTDCMWPVVGACLDVQGPGVYPNTGKRKGSSRPPSHSNTLFPLYINSEDSDLSVPVVIRSHIVLLSSSSNLSSID